MAEQEGVIKFQLEFTPAPPFTGEALAELNAWRKVLYLLRLIGQDPARYDGYGFGNISRRLSESRFVISGTQTGHLPELTPAHYATVLACHPAENRLVAEGPIRPSSKSMTHGTLYALDEQIQWVMHAHSPHIWRQAEALELPATGVDVPYGTPEMAAEVQRLFRETDVAEIGIFAMAGHEDGIVTFGPNAEAAGSVMLRHLSRAFQAEGIGRMEIG